MGAAAAERDGNDGPLLSAQLRNGLTMRGSDMGICAR